MSNNRRGVSRGLKNKFPVENLGGWDALIAEAEQRIQDLQFSIKVFNFKKNSGEPCPTGYVESDSHLIGIAAGTAKKAQSVPA